MCRPKYGSFALLAISILSIGCQNSAQPEPAAFAPMPPLAAGQPSRTAIAAGASNDALAAGEKPGMTSGVAGSVGTASVSSAAGPRTPTTPVTMADAPVVPHGGDASADDGPITKDDVITWTARGASEDCIIERIERSNAVFHLTAADENQLRDARVSDDVIRAMNDTGRRSF